MSTSNTELVEQFAIETQQHLDEIEPILTQAQDTSLDKPEIAALFRAFHSIKGLARLLDLHGLETLAHHSESFLSEVRAERQSLTPETLGLLLEALDGIRSLREQEIVHGTDAAAPQELIDALDAATKGAGSSEMTLSVAHHPVTETELHDDPDTLIYFAELLAECLPNLVVYAGGDGSQEQAAEDLETLMVAAERLKFDGLYNHLEQLSVATGKPSVERFAAVLADAQRFGRVIGYDVGADIVLAKADKLLRQAFVDAANEVAHALVSGEKGAGTPSAIAATERLVLLSSAGMEDCGLAALILQSLEDEVALEAALSAVGLLAIDLEADRTDLLKMAAERLRDGLASGCILPAALSKVLEDRGIALGRLGDLGALAIERLGTILDGGKLRLVVVTLSLPPRSDRLGFLRRLNRRLQPVSVRSLSVAGSESVALLVVESQTPESLLSELQSTFPDISFVEVRQLDGQYTDHPWSPPRLAGIGTGGGSADNQVRVPVAILDKLFGRIGEFFSISSALNVLVVDSQVPSCLQRLADHIMLEAPALLPLMDILQRQQRDLSQVEAEIHRLVSLIHEATLGLRVIPLDIVFNRFPRMIREIAKAQGKQVRFEARADGIKVDKGMTELLSDPLMHMLRNALDHGIEAPEERMANNKPALSHIRMSAVQNGNRITVEIADDGRGINTERVRLRAIEQGLTSEQESQNLSKEQIHRFLFTPGFSTAEQVTDTSGRGVGMDVALVNVSRLGGRIDIHTIPGQGTTFRLDMPLSAAMQTVLLAETTVQTVAFPERMVVEAVTVSRSAIQFVNGQRSILLHNRFLPLFRLAELLHLPEFGTGTNK